MFFVFFFNSEPAKPEFLRPVTKPRFRYDRKKKEGIFIYLYIFFIYQSYHCSHVITNNTFFIIIVNCSLIHKTFEKRNYVLNSKETESFRKSCKNHCCHLL